MINQVLHHHLTTVETTGDDILCPHGVTDIHRDDGFNAYPLLVVDLRTHLRTGQHHDEQSQGSLQDPEFHRGADARHIGHQCLQQARVAEFAQPFLLITERYESNQRQYRNQRQQIEVYGVFKSEHISILYGMRRKIVIRSRISSNKAMMAARAKG